MFSYQENSVSYQYIAVMGGANTSTYASENVPALTGSPVGCTPLASADYTFAGWFKDEQCTVAVDPAVDAVTIDANGKLVPTRADSDANGTLLYEGGVYYAKFDYNFSTLTITTEGCSDEDQVFLFLVQGKEGTSVADVNLTVAVKANGSATLENVRVGDYVITQLTEWSWRYEIDGEQTVQVNVSAYNAGNNVVFDQSKKTNKWLDGNGHGHFLLQ